MTKQMKKALAALIEKAEGYSATPEQIGQVAAEYEIEAWQLEGFFFDAAETAGEA
jgi:hypothetical protein